VGRRAGTHRQMSLCNSPIKRAFGQEVVAPAM
jgi:hypothetical protein